VFHESVQVVAAVAAEPPASHCGWSQESLCDQSGYRRQAARMQRILNAVLDVVAVLVIFEAKPTHALQHSVGVVKPAT